MNEVYLKIKKWPEIRNLGIIVFVAALFVLPQIFSKGIILGGDSLFQFNRIYDDAMQLQNKSISYFQMNYGFSSAGRIANALYGPFSTYILGGLLLVLGGWLKFEVISSFLIYVVAGVGMYCLTKRLGINSYLRVLSAVLYLTTYDIMCWQYAQQFSAFAAMLLPYVLIMATNIATSPEKLNTLNLMIVISLIVETHMMTALMAVILLVPFFVFGLLNTSHKFLLLKKVIFAAFGSILLTANVWMATLHVFGSNNLVPPFPFQNTSVFTKNFSFNQGDMTSLGIILSVLFLAEFFYVWVVKSNKFIRFYISTGMVFLIVSSQLVPWNSLSKSFSEITTFLQFPFRISAIANVLLISGLFYCINKIVTENSKLESVLKVVMLIAVFMSFFSSYTTIQNRADQWNSNNPLQQDKSNLVISGSKRPDSIRNAFGSSVLNLGIEKVQKATPDYLPARNPVSANNYQRLNPYKKYAQEILHNSGFNVWVNHQGRLSISWLGKSEKIVTVPVSIYSDSKVKINSKKIAKIKKVTTIGTLRIKQRKGTNYVVLWYKMPKIISYAIKLSLVCWVSIIIVWFIYLVRLLCFKWMAA
jgi:hypothetical protein